jgi:hypothetical protein
MKQIFFSMVLLSIAALMVAPSSGQVTFNFSTDLGSDLDLSDPNANGLEFMDCGDIYIENPLVPIRVKDDSYSQFPGDGDADGDGQNTGYPYQTALQPASNIVGTFGPNPGPIVIEEQYESYFDLDADDQIQWSLAENYQGMGNEVVTVPQGLPGVSFEPTSIVLSFEDDGPAGWVVNPDVPTVVAPDNAVEIFGDSGMFWAGMPGASWSPPSINPVRTETMMGMAPDPPGTLNDDDVDALDTEIHQFWYWSADHEANMGDDPGSIYETDQFATGVNKVQVIDDSAPAAATGLWLGVPPDTDVDAWEFVAISEMTYNDIFGMPPIGAIPGDWILCGLFSPDADDPDTVQSSDLYGNESGGMMDGDVYISNLIGTSVLMANYQDGVDAITVPEPTTVVMLLALMVGFIAYRRR